MPSNIGTLPVSNTGGGTPRNWPPWHTATATSTTPPPRPWPWFRNDTTPRPPPRRHTEEAHRHRGTGHHWPPSSHLKGEGRDRGDRHTTTATVKPVETVAHRHRHHRGTPRPRPPVKATAEVLNLCHGRGVPPPVETPPHLKGDATSGGTPRPWRRPPRNWPPWRHTETEAHRHGHGEGTPPPLATTGHQWRPRHTATAFMVETSAPVQYVAARNVCVCVEIEAKILLNARKTWTEKIETIWQCSPRNSSKRRANQVVKCYLAMRAKMPAFGPAGGCRILTVCLYAQRAAARDNATLMLSSKRTPRPVGVVGRVRVPK